MVKFKWLVGMVAGLFLLAGCKQKASKDHLRFAVSPDYPPFEYKSNGELKGFEVELACKVADELKKKPIFEEMQFSTLLVAVQSGMVDAAVSTLTITRERQRHFDFSQTYHKEKMVLIFLKAKPVHDLKGFSGRGVACQLGTTMELWLKERFPQVERVTVDYAAQAIELLKAGHVEAVLIDLNQGAEFARQDKQLSYSYVAESESGYGFALKKGSPFKAQIDKALQTLKEKGVLRQLEDKYLKRVL